MIIIRLSYRKLHTTAYLKLHLRLPQSAMSSKMSDTLQLLVAGADHLRDQCIVATDIAAASQESRMHTQQVIQSAYDIAKAAKQLVMLFE